MGFGPKNRETYTIKRVDLRSKRKHNCGLKAQRMKTSGPDTSKQNKNGPQSQMKDKMGLMA